MGHLAFLSAPDAPVLVLLFNRGCLWGVEWSLDEVEDGHARRSTRVPRSISIPHHGCVYVCVCLCARFPWSPFPSSCKGKHVYTGGNKPLDRRRPLCECRSSDRRLHFSQSLPIQRPKANRHVPEENGSAYLGTVRDRGGEGRNDKNQSQYCFFPYRAKIPLSNGDLLGLEINFRKKKKGPLFACCCPCRMPGANRLTLSSNPFARQAKVRLDLARD